MSDIMMSDDGERPAPTATPPDPLAALLGPLREYVEEAADRADSQIADSETAYAGGRATAAADMLALATTALTTLARERDEAMALAAQEKQCAVSAYAQRSEAFTRERSALAALRGLVEAARHSNEVDGISRSAPLRDAIEAAEARLAGAPPPIAHGPKANGDKDRHEWTCLEHIADALRLPAEWGKMSLLMAVRDVVQHLRPLEGETMADASKRYVDIAEHHVEILDAAVDALDCDKYTRIASAAEELRAEACLPRLGDTVSGGGGGAEAAGEALSVTIKPASVVAGRRYWTVEVGGQDIIEEATSRDVSVAEDVAMALGARVVRQ